MNSDVRVKDSLFINLDGAARLGMIMLKMGAFSKMFKHLYFWRGEPHPVRQE
jgi:hypothetical protein